VAIIGINRDAPTGDKIAHDISSGGPEFHPLHFYRRFICMQTIMELLKHWAATLDDYTIDLAWSPDGTQLAAASAAGGITLYAALDGAVQHTLPGHDDGANCLAWSPDGTALATGGQDGLVKLWDPSAGQHVTSVEMGGAWVEHLAWRPGPDSTWLAASAGKKLSAIRRDGSILHSFKDAPKSISAVSWHPQGGCVAVSYFGGVCLWDADDFVPQKEFPYNNGIQALVWSPDARWLVSGNQDPSVHLWVPEEDMELAGIPGQSDLNPGSLQPRNQELDLVPEHFRLTKLDQHGRQTGESLLQQIDSGEPWVRTLQIGILPKIQHLLAEDVTLSAFDHAAPFGGRVDPGRQQDAGGRESRTTIAQRSSSGTSEHMCEDRAPGSIGIALSGR